MAAKKPYRSLKAGGESYKLRFSTNAIIEFEEEYGDSIMAFGQKMNASAPDENGEVDPDAPQILYKELRLLVWAALQEHHEDIGEKEVGTIIDKAGGMRAAFEVANGALADAMPADEDAEEESTNGSSANAGPKLAEAQG